VILIADGFLRSLLLQTLMARTRFYRNLGNGQFEDVTAAPPVLPAQTQASRGAVFADIDGDGQARSDP